MRQLTTAEGEVLGLAFSPDGSALAAAVMDRGVYLFNLGSGGPPVRLHDEGPAERSANLFFSPHGRRVHWLGGNGWLSYDRDERKTEVHGLDSIGRLLWFARTPDGRLFTRHRFPDDAVIGWRPDPDDGWIKTWKVNTLDLSIDGHNQALCHTGERFLIVGRAADRTASGSARWWEKNPYKLFLHSTRDGRVEATGTFPYDRVDRLAFSPDGSQLVAAHQITLLVWSVPGLGEPRLIRNPARKPTRKHFTAIAFDPSGRHLFASNNDGSVHVFDTATWRSVGRLAWRIGPLRAVAVSPDGTLAAAGSKHGEIVVWDLDG